VTYPSPLFPSLAGVLCLAVEPAIAHGGSLDQAATTVLQHLDLSGVPGFGIRDPLAIAVIARQDSADDVSSGEAPLITRPLASLLRSRLEQQGATALFVLDAPASAAEAEVIAREAGAEWLLLVSVEPVAREALRMWTELKMVDRGLWIQPPDPGAATIYATAEDSLRIDDTLKSLLARTEIRTEKLHSDSHDALRLDGVPMRIASFEDRVLAMAACDPPTGGKTALVLVLDTKSIAALSFEGGSLRRIGGLDLTKLPRAGTVSRDPIGAIACSRSDRTDRREIVFGSSFLKTGYVARVEPGGAGQMSFTIVRTVEGVPLGFMPGGRMVLADIDGGRNRYSSTLRVEEKGHFADRELRAPLVDLALEPSGPEGYRAIGVSADYRLIRFDDNLEKASPLGSSGAGIRIVGDGDSPALVATSSAALPDRDRVRLLALAKNGVRRLDAIDVEGSVYATAIGSIRTLDARDLIIASYRAPLKRTEIIAVKLVAPRGSP
jgi:hypothetical protein